MRYDYIQSIGEFNIYAIINVNSCIGKKGALYGYSVRKRSPFDKYGWLKPARYGESAWDVNSLEYAIQLANRMVSKGV